VTTFGTAAARVFAAGVTFIAVLGCGVGCARTRSSIDPPPRADNAPATPAPRVAPAAPVPPPSVTPPPRRDAPRSAPAALSAPATGKAAPAKAVPSKGLDLTSRENRLRSTNAIGVFTKLALKNQIDDLLGQFKLFHRGSGPALNTLRERYDFLLMKVLSLLQDDDPGLARDVSASRETIWAILVDPARFAGLG
jgi:hypothetical protein